MYLKKIIYITMFFVLLVACTNDKKYNVYEVTENDINDKDENFSILSQSSEVVNSNVKFNFASSITFPELETKNIDINGDNYQYFINNDGLVEMNLRLENRSGEDKEIMYFILLDNELAEISLNKIGENITSRVLDLNIGNEEISELNFNVKMNDSVNEVFSFALDKSLPDDYYYDAKPVVTRQLITEKIYEVNPMERNIDLKSIEQDNNMASFNINLLNKKSENLTPLKEEASKLEIISGAFDLNLDVIWFNDKGESEVISNDLEITKAENKTLDLNIDLDNESRNFLLVKNLKGVDVLRDVYAVNHDNVPLLTTQQVVIEIP